MVGLLIEELSLGAGDVVVVERRNDLCAGIERGVNHAGRDSGLPQVGVDDGVFGVASFEDLLQLFVGWPRVRHLDEARHIHDGFGLADGVKVNVSEAAEVRIDLPKSGEEVDLVTGVSQVFGAEERAFGRTAADYRVVVDNDDAHQTLRDSRFCSHAHAVRRMVWRSLWLGVQFRICLASAGSAYRLGGSPARRGWYSTGTGRPVILAAVSMTSCTE